MPIKIEKDDISDAFEKALRKFPEQREKMFRKLGNAVLQQVRGGIGVYKTGKVQTWQETHIGSLG